MDRSGKGLTGSRTIGEKQIIPWCVESKEQSGNNGRTRNELTKTKG
jgi:hypothetical protein